MINDNVKAVLENAIWDIATYGEDGPNVVPVGFKAVLDDGKLAVGDVFLETTLKNLEANGKIAISAYNVETMEAYQIKGTAVHITEGPVVDQFQAMAEQMFQGAVSAKGALMITPEKVIVTSPGPDNKKEL